MSFGEFEFLEGVRFNYDLFDYVVGISSRVVGVIAIQRVVNVSREVIREIWDFKVVFQICLSIYDIFVKK